ncbi:PQQ-binding-like beta-propeller repeat protein [Streptomyces violascens]|uniref:outer membrane protein assembly factor BamB family protein n=1 Tax=Streptomyces violascens TaxID=67381 RepID=UPI0037A695C8
MYAKTGLKEIGGYDPAKGTQRWKLPLPANVCVTTPQITADGITVIAYESEKVPGFDGGLCTEVAAVNVNTGKLLWHATMPTSGVAVSGSGDRKVGAAEIAISGGTAAVGGENDGGTAWEIATGRQLWKPQVTADNCLDNGYAGGSALVTVRQCGDPYHPTLSVQTLDPATGRPLTTYKVSSAFRYMYVLSTKPLVIGGYPGDGDVAKISDIYSVDDTTGKELAHITIPDEKYAIECKVAQVGTCRGPLAGGGKLFLPTTDHDNASPDAPGRTNEYLAFDLATGKPAPGRADAGDQQKLFPIRMDGNNVIALRTPPYQGHSAVVSIDGATLDQTVLMELPNDDKILNPVLGAFGMGTDDLLYDKGRLYIGDRLTDKANDEINGPHYLFAALGTN